MRLPLIAAAVAVAFGSPAQVSAEDRALLLGDELDLEKILESLDDKQPKSLTAQAPDWMRVLIRRTLEKESTRGLLAQLPRILGGGNVLEDLGKAVTRRAIERALATEDTWLSQPAEEIHLPDLVLLENAYSAIENMRVLLELLESSTPWRPLLAMVLSREYRLTKERYESLFTYIEKLPARARDLHARAAAIILRRSKDPEVTARVLRNLSHSYRLHGKLEIAALLLRESMRRTKKIKGSEWIHLGRLYAQVIDPVRSRRALRVAATLAKDTDERSRTEAAQRIAQVEATAKIADQIIALRREHGDDRGNEAKIQLLGLLRQLSRPLEAGELAQRLDNVPVKDSRVYANLGLLCMSGGLRKKAVTCLRIAEQLPNPDATLHQLRAWLMLRPLIEEGVLHFRGTGDWPRTMQRVAALRTDTRTLVANHGFEDFAIPALLLDLLAEFQPAIEAQDLRLAIEILRKNRARMLELRTKNYDILGLHQFALFGIAGIQDAGTIRKVLASSTPSERNRVELVRLRCSLAFLLLDADSSDETRQLCRSTFTELADTEVEKHLLLGHEAAITGRRTGEASHWRAAIEQFQKGLAVPKVAPNVKACLRNNIGICHHYLGEHEKAAAELATAIAADQEGMNPARLNVLTRAGEPDAAALAALSQLAESRKWPTLPAVIKNWQISASDATTARRLAQEIVADRFPLFRTRNPISLPVGGFSWSAGVSGKGADLRITFSITPWLMPPEPKTPAQIDALAK